VLVHGDHEVGAVGGPAGGRLHDHGRCTRVKS